MFSVRFAVAPDLKLRKICNRFQNLADSADNLTKAGWSWGASQRLTRTKERFGLQLMKS